MKQLRFVPLIVILIGATAIAQNPVPLVNQPLVPASAKPGSGGFTLTVNGTGFVPGASVLWNGSSRMTQVISNHQLTARIKASDVAKASTARIKVVNPSPGGGSSDPTYFPIRRSAKSVTFVRTLNAKLPSVGVVAVRDFNNDGKLDLAIGVEGLRHETGGSVYVYLGNGDGTFKPPIKTRTTVSPQMILAADLNNDGNADLVIATQGKKKYVQVLLGKGDGTFAEETPFVNVEPNTFLAVADFNGDGKLDLYTSSGTAFVSGFSIFLGNGDGTFQAKPVFSGRDSGTPAIGDFNGDGILDLAVTTGDGVSLDVYLGNGDGTFGQPATYSPANGGTSAITAADVNGDGKLDLITDGVSVLLGNGDGTFKDDGGVGQLGPGYNLQVGDFNGDGKLDVAFTDNFTTKINLLLGMGDGTFGSPITTYGSGSAFLSILAVGDFNNDGKLDLVDSSSVVNVFLQH